MILEKTTRMNVRTLRKLTTPMRVSPAVEAVCDALSGFLELIPLYDGAMKLVSTKLEVLDEEFATLNDRNPIHHIECRLKTIESIADKTLRRGYPQTVDGLREHMRDIAGLRVICHYVSDVYRLADMLLSQKDVALLRRSDYIQTPKASGYRSLHLVVSVPVYLSDRMENVPVEIQLRTVAMDMWANLEHDLQYKANGELAAALVKRLGSCASIAAHLDMEMEAVLRDSPKRDA